MRSFSWWLEWPAGALRIGVVFLMSVTTLAAAIRYPAVLHSLGERASENSALSYADREVGGGNAVVADQLAVYTTRGLIPEDETFRVLVGSNFTGGSPLTPPYVASYYRYFLLPRRYADDAPWIVCYGCDRASLGVPVDVVWHGDEGISILRVRS